MHDEVKRILNKWGNNDISPESYLFPIFPFHSISLLSEESIRSRRRMQINHILCSIGKAIGFEFNLTIGLARHSFATTLKLNGTNVSFISEMLGHTSMKTTMHYLKSIPSNERKAVSDSLLSFAV